MAAEDVVTYPRSIGGVKVAVLLREEAPGLVKVSLRGKGEVPVNRSPAASAGAVTRTPPGARCRARWPTPPPPSSRRFARPWAPRSGDRRAPRSVALRHPCRREGGRRHVLPGRGASPPAPACAQGRPRWHPRSRRHRPPAHPGRRGHQAHAVSHRSRQGIRGGRAARAHHRHPGRVGTRAHHTARSPRWTRRPSARPSARFVGEIEQIPPMYSALHHEGRRLYELAREGTEVERAPRRVTVHAITLESLDLPEMTFRVRCGKGTYVRTLAADLGEALGTGAALARLVRTRVGPVSPRGCGGLDGAARRPGWRRALVAPPPAGLRPRRPAGLRARRASGPGLRPWPVGARAPCRHRPRPCVRSGRRAPRRGRGRGWPRQARTTPSCGFFADSRPSRLS